MSDFFQAGPSLGNQYDEDLVLVAYLQHVWPAEIHAALAPDLRRFGQRVVSDILAMANDAEAHPPRHVPYDPWGRRIDQIVVARGWEDLGRVAAEEGLIAIAYEREYGEWSRVYQFAKLYLFGPSSAIYNCPLAMSDGAAKLLHMCGEGAAWQQQAFAHLISRDPHAVWTSGQWMTERSGGSDVGQTETIAIPEEGGYKLFGTKWFTSATTAQMALTLARVVAADGSLVPGSRGLSLFYLETRDAVGKLNGMSILRLKDKLGTRAMPTAEINLDGVWANMIGKEGTGVKNIAWQFNITRIHNAIAAVGMMRRILALAKDYARRRQAFGKTLAEQPLHRETLADLDVNFRACFHLAFCVVGLLGRNESGKTQGHANTDDALLLRLLTPVVKLFTAKQATAVVSEALECFGGAGYIEDTGIPKWLRDAQVLSIWEGTTNVLSLDVLRALGKEKAFPPFAALVRQCLASVQQPLLQPALNQVRAALERLSLAMADVRMRDESNARALAFSLARILAGALLLEQAQWEMAGNKSMTAAYAAIRWCRTDLCPLPLAGAYDADEATLLVNGA